MNIEINEADECKNEYWQIKQFWEVFQKLLNSVKYPTPTLEKVSHHIFLNPLFYDDHSNHNEIDNCFLANFYRKLIERKEKTRNHYILKPNNFFVEYRYYCSETYGYSYILNKFKILI